MRQSSYEHNGICAVDEFMNNNNRMPRMYIRELQDEHNVNLNSAGEGDEYFEVEDDSDLHEVDEDEFIERFTETGAAEQQLYNLGYQL